MGSPQEVMLACEPAPIAPPSIELDFQEPGQREQYAIQRIQFALGEYLCWAAPLNLYIAIEGRQCLPCVSPIIAAGAVISGAYLKPGEAMHGLMKIDISGAAAMLSVMSALAALWCNTVVTGYLMYTDNMPSALAEACD